MVRIHDQRSPYRATGSPWLTRLVLAAALTNACGWNVGVDPTTSTTPAKPTCPNLESQLDQLAHSSDPVALAVRSGLVLVDGAVRVIIETRGSPDLHAYGFAEEARYAGQLQGYVPIVSLCAVSSAPGVTSVRLTDQPEPAGGPGKP